MREKIADNPFNLGQEADQFPILQVDQRPTLFRDVEWVWEGFSSLSGSRQMGYASTQPIPVSEMLAYLNFRGIEDSDDREEFIFLVQRLDRQVIAEQIAKSKTPTPPQHSRNPPR